MQLYFWGSLLLIAGLIENVASARVHHGHTTIPRPTIVPKPYGPGITHYKSPRRDRTCFVDALGNGQDDGPNILAATKKCNNGGTVALLDELYTIGTALDLTFLNAIDFDIQGTIKFTNDINYWTANSFKFKYQNATVFWQFGGSDVNIYGSGVGTIDGSGQVWYDAYAANPLILRPILMGIVGLKGGTVSGLNLRYSPQWYHFVANSTDVIFDNITISGGSTSSHVAKNTGMNEKSRG